MVSFVNYDEKTQSLVVSFPNGSKYTYENVPKSLADGMKYADAFGVEAGKFFVDYIRKSYQGRRTA